MAKKKIEEVEQIEINQDEVINNVGDMVGTITNEDFPSLYKCQYCNSEMTMPTKYCSRKCAIDARMERMKLGKRQMFAKFAK